MIDKLKKKLGEEAELLQRELNVTPKQLVELAKAIFTWKELLNSARQLRLMPALKTSSHDHGT